MGGHQEGELFKGIYDKTLSYYQALFKNQRPKEIWENGDERFQEAVFACSMVNLPRLANLAVYTAFLPEFGFKSSLVNLRRARLEMGPRAKPFMSETRES